MPERCGSLCVEARHTPAEGAPVGGDLYDVIDTMYGVRAIIADVTGHGRLAAALAGEARKAFGELAPSEPRLLGLARRLDSFVTERVGRSYETFVSAALVEIGRDTADLLVCGHPVPLMVRRGRVWPVGVLDVALPLGLWRLTGGNGSEPTTFGFTPGDALLMYTDGAIDARDGTGKTYPLESRLAGLCAEDAAGLPARLEAELLAHSDGHLNDDVALLLLRHELYQAELGGRRPPQGERRR
ncbi:PP2C family protein-serine/threonine phosphatase [Rhizohabitans arisaemae]|uniref:PP2C family protein-serine/threonine phosphatase n=1 Tax=Rhizohabitans arisaemae TaxID=2720610 RepID=UPI0024B0BE49|nr:PP2C family protein-serine/threonine phosphatase [Rhizohabitans arisaemae]